jgi:hypothetical protein
MMSHGTAIFIIGLLYFPINYPEFRKIVIWTAVIAVIVLVIVMNK